MNILLNKLKGLSRDKNNPKGISPKKLKIVQEREDAILSFLGYFVFKHPVMSKEDYAEIYQIFDIHYIQYFKSKLVFEFLLIAQLSNVLIYRSVIKPLQV